MVTRKHIIFPVDACLTEWSRWDIGNLMFNFSRPTQGAAYNQACFRTCHHARRGCTIPLLQLHSYLHVGVASEAQKVRGRQEV